MKQKQVLLVCPVALALVGALLGCGGGSANPAATPTPVATPTPAPAATYTLVPLSPAALLSKSTTVMAVDASGSVQGGESYTNINDSHALLWRGTAASMIDLGVGKVRAVGSTVQIGLTGVEGLASERARLWRDTEASGVSLHPAGYVSSHAVGGDDDIQVGRGRPTDSTSHALLWRGTAASVVDLGLGIAWAVAGDTQVGQGTGAGGFAHALLWRGSEASRVDLHPAGFDDSRAFGVANGRQAGYGTTTGGSSHALVWEGTAASATDLHSVTSGYLINGAPPVSSSAYGIDNSGNVVGSVRSVTGQDYAVLWRRN